MKFKGFPAYRQAGRFRGNDTPKFWVITMTLHCGGIDRNLIDNAIVRIEELRINLN